MTESECRRWLKEHARYFPGINTWIGNLDDWDGVLGKWFELLASCSMGDCLIASRRLYESAGKAPIYERHPQAVRSIIREIELERTAQSLKPRFVDGEQVFNCLLCQDDGRVICWSKKSMEAAADGTLGQPFTHYSCAVACSCVAGDSQWMARYDPERWLLYPRWMVGPNEYSELRKFVAGLGRTKEAVF